MRAKVQDKVRGFVAAAGAACVGMPGAVRPAASEGERARHLGALGFSAPAAQHALRRCGGDLEAAAAWLLDAANADEILAAEAQAAEEPAAGPPAAVAAPFLAPSALRPAGTEFAALSAQRSKGEEEPSEEALRQRLRTLLPEFGRELEECLAALSREELREAVACLEAEVRAGGQGRAAQGGAPGGRGPQGGEEFFVRLDHRSGRPSGLVVDQQTLTVVDVTPGSSAASWNAANSDFVVRPGDTVWEVNGTSEPQVIVSHLTAQVPLGGQDLMVGLRRPVTTAAVAAFRSSCTPAAGADFLLPQALRSQQLQSAGAAPLRQWLPPIARGGSRRGSGASLEGSLDEATAHFGRVDAAELEERLRAKGQASATAGPAPTERPLAATEVEPEAEETLLDPVTPEVGNCTECAEPEASREASAEAGAGISRVGVAPVAADVSCAEQAEDAPMTEEESLGTSCLTMTFVEMPGTMEQLVVGAREASAGGGPSLGAATAEAPGSSPAPLAGVPPTAAAADQGGAPAVEDGDSGMGRG